MSDLAFANLAKDFDKSKDEPTKKFEVRIEGRAGFEIPVDPSRVAKIHFHSRQGEVGVLASPVEDDFVNITFEMRGATHLDLIEASQAAMRREITEQMDSSVERGSPGVYGAGTDFTPTTARYTPEELQMLSDEAVANPPSADEDRVIRQELGGSKANESIDKSGEIREEKTVIQRFIDQKKGEQEKEEKTAVKTASKETAEKK